ncbi:MAG: 30S ribosomal protein S20 [Omnitrophica bacterium RBG_13_46_9]|nr:MAG: 30S ribosomal protein S20 [Omnitrophica bacterium RBG_13_46_9]
MPQKRSAYKELRKSKKRHFRNTRITSEVKTLIKKYDFLLSEKKFDQAKELLKTVASKMGKASAKGIIHKNVTSRKISRLSKKMHQAMGAKK